MTTWRYLQHIPDGEWFAALIGASGQIEQVRGPLRYIEMTEANLADGNFNYEPGDLDWARAEDANGNWQLDWARAEGN